MPSIAPLVALATLFASVPVCAQSSQSIAQLFTPRALLGVGLQGDFMTEVKECAAENERHDQPCRIATKDAGRFEVRGLPYLPISPGYKLFATVSDGTVSRLVLTGNTGNLYLVKEMLTDKLGKPATSETRWIKLNSGASYETEAYKWNTEKMAIDFSQDPSDPGRYAVTFTASNTGENSDQNATITSAKSSSL